MDDNDLLGSLDCHGELSELVKARRWGAVVDICEKKRKKGDTRDHVQASRGVCEIVARLVDPKIGSKESARQDLDALLGRRLPVTEASTLSLLESLAQAYHGGSELTEKLGRIWERAAGALPKNEWVLHTWFQSKFRKGLYKEAKQASMVWMKAYPKHHDPFYLFIFVNFVISKAPQTSDTERTLCQLLAYKALATAAVDTVVKEDVIAKGLGRILEGEDDLTLLLRVYKDQSKYVEALNILEDMWKGSASPLGSRSWELALQTIELQGLCGRWELQWRTCQEILQESRPKKFKRENSGSKLAFGERGDDWKVWDGLVAATNEFFVEKPDIVKEAEQLIADFSVPKSRNASLAFLNLHSKGAVADPTSKKLFKKCQKYFEDYSTRIACFQDLRPYLAGLARCHQEMLVANVSRHVKDRKPASILKAAWVKQIISDINSLKLDYHLVVSPNNHRDEPDLLPAFVTTCLRLYNAYILLHIQLPQSDRGSADDAAMLAAMGLIMMYNLGDRTALLRSIVVLEYLLSHSKHNYDALLILVRIYMYLGAGSLAMDRYTRLTTKNIQHASISWIFFTRLSTIHPWPANISAGGTAMTTFDPLDEIKQAIDWHHGAGILTEKALSRMMSNKQWNMMLGLMEIQHALQYGFARAMLIAEYQRIQRTRTVAQKATWDTRLAVPLTVYDNRDRTAYPNYQAADQPTFEEGLPTASPLASANSRWLAQEFSLSCLWDHLNNKEWSHRESRRLQASFSESADDSNEAFTTLETCINRIFSRLRELLSLTALQPKISMEAILTQLKSIHSGITNQLGKYLEQGNGLLITMALNGGLQIPSWHVFHTSFSLLEMGRFVQQCMNKITAYSATQSDGDARKRLEKEVESIRSLCNDLQKTLNRNMTDLRDTIAHFERGCPNALQVLVKGKDDLGTEMDSLIAGTVTMDKVCSMLQESWIDAFDGVVRTGQTT
ncbi:MAG: hypothetical protein Q9217_001757 [Psora testacea]